MKDISRDMSKGKQVLMLSIVLVFSFLVLPFPALAGSVTIELNDNVIHNLGDCRIRDASSDYGGQVMWNISMITGEVTQATLCLWFYNQNTAPVDDDTLMERVTDHTWKEGISAAAADAQGVDTTSNPSLNNTATNDWACMDVTAIIEADRLAGWWNSTIRWNDNDYPVDTISVTSDNEAGFGRYGTAYDAVNNREDTGGSGKTPVLHVTYDDGIVINEEFVISYTGVTQYNQSDSSRYTGEFINFTANVTDTSTGLKEVYFYWNGTAVNLTNTNSTPWGFDEIIDLPAGSWNITWYATNYTDSDTDAFTYTILKGTTTLNITVNDSFGSIGIIDRNVSIGTLATMPYTN